MWNFYYKWLAYVINRAAHSNSVTLKKYQLGEIKTKRQMYLELWKNYLIGKLTYLHRHMGEEMVPTLGGQGEILLVRKLPFPTVRNTFVGDVVVLKNPKNSDNHLVRRVAALEGYEMVSNDEKDEPFVLEEDQCWVLSDNVSMKVKEAKDSRTFGPISVDNILGRVIYRLRTAKDHGSIQNSKQSMNFDESVLEVELDVDKMARKSTET